MILHFFSAVAGFLGHQPTPEPEVRVIASYYSDQYEGRAMANGKAFRQDRLTCATNDWPLGTKLRVRYNERTVDVVVTDRMHPRFSKVRIDLTTSAFRRLSPLTPGILPVAVTRLR